MYSACSDTSVIAIDIRKSKTHALADTYCSQAGVRSQLVCKRVLPKHTVSKVCCSYVLMDKADYKAKMMTIFGDETKFECIGPCKDHDLTGQNERALQTFLLRQHKAGEISKDVYDRIRPTGSV